ncbi:MAG: hypothetical protein H6R10_1703 [Rhodocyclaceae bacterium]|nr:hypothetical protein [Rhodocyclaceae bacterium]
MQNGMQRQMNTNTNINLLESCSDQLERLVLEEVHKRRRSRNPVSALVIPAVRADVTIELARLGCSVTGVDEACHENDFKGRALAAGSTDDLSFLAGNLESLPDRICGGPFDIIYIRRGLCTLPYPRARQILRKLLGNLKIGGKLYVSVLGMHSELGDHYPEAEKAVEDRFCPLDPGMAQKYGIADPVCLYSERNLFLLLMEAGGSVLRTFTTTHGNVKGVAVRV